jgi:chromosome segregation ATPase
MKRDFNCGTGSGGFEPGNSCAGGGGGGGGGDSSGGSSGGGGDEGGGSGTGARGERLRDRIEGTQAEANREVAKTSRQVRDIKAKIEQIKQRDPSNATKSLEKKLAANQQKQADIASKLQASNARIAALKAQLKK